MKKLYLLIAILVISLQFAMTENVLGQITCSGYLQHYWKLEENNLNTFYDYAGTLNANVSIIPSRVQGIVNFGQSFNGLAEASLPDDNSFDWSANSSFSIEYWVNKSSVCNDQTSSSNNVILGRDDASTQLHWWTGVSCTSPGSINFNLIANDGSGQNLLSKRGIIDGNWHHVAIIRDGSLSTTSIYIDGVRDTTITLTYTGNFASTVPVNIGWLNLNTLYHFNGSLDELAIYDRAISATEIQDHYNSGNGISYCSQPIIPVVKILTLGNSITYDTYSGDIRPVGQRTGYRIHLYNKLIGAGYNFDFIGSETAGQDLFPDPQNGGFPGITKEQMVTLLQTGYNPLTALQITNGAYLDFYQPDVILLHIGTNYVSTDITAINQILNIIDTYRNQSGKNVKLLIAKIINRGIYDLTTTQYNQNLEAAVIAHNVSNNYIVDMENGAGINYSTDMIDNLHPNNIGYEKIATLWYSTLTSILDAPPNQPGFIKAPSNLIANPLPLEIGLTWTDNSTNENGFRVERKTGSGAFAQVAELAANTVSYTDVGLQASTSYTYRVYAFNSAGSSAYSNESAAQTPAESPIINLAPGKPVIQSSTAYGGVAERANDNNTSGEWNNNSVAHTVYTQSPWWQIDLQGNYNIDHLEVWNRTDGCCFARMANYYVFVSDVPFTSGDLNTTLNQSGVWSSFNANYPNPGTTIPVNRTGQYVRIQLANANELNLAELKVFGNSGQPPVPSVPNAPTGLITQATSAVSVQLNWTDNATNETVFRIERKTGSGVFAQVAELAANTVSYADMGLLESTSYTYRVYAFNNTGSSAYSNESTVQTPAATTITNLAPGKPVIQSSTAYGGVAERANDNNTSGEWNNNSVAHTVYTQSPWWQIDLQGNYNIDHLEVWNRTDGCCFARMANYYVFVSDVPFTSGDLNTTLNQSGVWSSFNANYPNPGTTIPVNRTGQYVRIQLANANELNLAELKVFGNSGQPPVPSVPNAPTGLITQATSAVSVQLNWTDNATNETVFRIERKTGSGVFAQVAELAANTVSYADMGLLESTSYTYRVYAFNNTGSSAYSNESTVQTPAATTITNLAPGKPVIQSSTAYGGVAERANDNNTSGEWNNNSVAHTVYTQSPWWQIDLQGNYNIDHLEVWNRTDGCCFARMANYYVFVSDVPFTSGDLNTTLNQSGVWSSFNANYPNPGTTIPVNRTGQYVRIQLANANELNLAELKVFGNSGQPPVPSVPNAPTGLITQATSAVSVQLNWTDNATNETVFRIERKTGSGVFAQVAELAANTVSYADMGLLESTSYTYRVYAFNNTGSSAYSNESTVQTPAATTITNLAPGKPVIQSSTAYGGVAERANDNNTSGEWNNNSVAHTVYTQSPWWQIDLQGNYNIDHLEVWNRTDGCCFARMANYYVFVSDVPFTSGDLNTTLNQSGVWSSFNANYPNPGTTIPVNRTGQYVRIQLANANELNLAELKVFGNSLLKSIGNQPDLSESDNFEVYIYPNPSINEVNIEFYLNRESKGSISIFDIMGREQKKLTDELFYSGKNLFTWNGSDAEGKRTSPGIYIIRLIINEKVYLKKVIITR